MPRRIVLVRSALWLGHWLMGSSWGGKVMGARARSVRGGAGAEAAGGVRVLIPVPWSVFKMLIRVKRSAE